MKKVISIDEASKIAKKLNSENKKIVLAGGCFDILHTGHIKYFNDSKKAGDILMVLLESDTNIKKYKGKDRPINDQNNRSIVLSALSFIDYVIPLKGVTNGEDYDKLIVQIKPACISITAGDENIDKRIEQCNLVNAKLLKVEKLDGISSSSYIKNI